MSKLWLTSKHCISRAGTLPKRPLAVETCNTYTPSSGASVSSESACGEYSFPSVHQDHFHTTPQFLSVILVSLSLLVNQPIPLHSGGGGGGVLTLSRPSLGHTDPSGAAPWALIPLFLSRVGLAPALALSLAWASRPLFLSLAALSLVTPPHAQKCVGVCGCVCVIVAVWMG